jgi:hypothetical protein
MPESEDKKTFAESLLAQDVPPVDKQIQHKDALFKKIKRHVWLGKIVGGSIYLVLFAVAFWAYQQQPKHTDNMVHSICWGAVSLHILLWFLIYFLRAIYRTLAETMEQYPDKDQRHPWRKQDRFITAMAVLVFAFSTYRLYRSFLFTDPFRAAGAATSIFWATVFFLFWYPFVTASLAAKLWLEHKKMQLCISTSKSSNSENQDNDALKMRAV